MNKYPQFPPAPRFDFEAKRSLCREGTCCLQTADRVTSAPPSLVESLGAWQEVVDARPLGRTCEPVPERKPVNPLLDASSLLGA